MLVITRAAALIGLVCATGAVVAHSLAREQVQRTKADTIMARIYDVSQSDRGQELMQEILDAVYVRPEPRPRTRASGSPRTSTPPA